MGSARKLFLMYMPRPNSQLEMFVHAYFHTSLRANLLDGDIREDYPRGAIVKLISQLGFGGDDEMVPLSDP